MLGWKEVGKLSKPKYENHIVNEKSEISRSTETDKKLPFERRNTIKRGDYQYLQIYFIYKIDEYSVFSYLLSY